ncbi:MAG: 5-(carboxyamino)imidazole ribonucleotide synthase [Cryomorphaceae bacterium]|jgi:5-(carboxyamino)imidazole ribonucleotide synthase|nr:5-(carboxyamino)imidazole ribonucleotide synthase [Cryomorphaceae bacterium]MBT3684568.1 5-(carboxyamino)imidazole ribonucleotide synthase [Cryomorphaceae bacterium]MBT4237151.1 5-(carboxyamino)imidazole ribonucleotide synthase [Cryomorphaceae bacterium]MBT4813200.1 5-(carboxyamino)imidazole ribonucleotide synthase [Cryomorphaceae bacterium]MBT5416755.1 5-(carboxyamino)imidazole ribonucleotide synthase [Cryomorphaceae bacterium]
MLGENKILGILGGGQLGKMILDVSNRWGLKVFVLDSNIECPSSKLCSKFFVGDLMDYDSVVQFGENVDLITIEIENVNVDALKFLESKGKKVFPQPRVIEIIQDKSKQKEFYINNGIPTSSFRSCNGIEELKDLISKGEISYPFIWKASKMGYDGYGVNKIFDNKGLENLSDCHCIVEELISIKKELSVMVALRESGEILNYPVVEMEFNKDSNQVEYILSPAQISQELKIKAEKLANNIAEKFKICGIIAVEMFLTNEDEILINEVAPRPHNSYHFSIEGSYTSQFEQFLRAILDLPLGSTKILQNSVMVNLVGEENSKGIVEYKNFDQIIGIEGVNPHIYGKFETRPNRKMGHITIINEDIDLAKRIAKEIKETVIITTKK